MTPEVRAAIEEQERRRAMECERRGGWYVGSCISAGVRGVTRRRGCLHGIVSPPARRPRLEPDGDLPRCRRRPQPGGRHPVRAGLRRLRE